MRINKMHLKNFRCFENFTIEFEDDLTVIVAENGRGKSAILDAVAVAVGPYIGCFNGVKTYSFEDSDVMQVQQDTNDSKLRILRMKRQYPIVLEAEGVLGGKTVSWRREMMREGGRTTVKNAKALTDYGRNVQKAVHSKHDENIILPVIAYYGTTRMWEDAKILAGNRKKINLERDSGYFEAMEPANTYQTFGHWFQYAALSAMEFDRYLKERNSDEKNPYREVLKAVSRAIGISLSSMGWKDIDYSVSLQSLVVTHEHIGTLPVSALSDGIRSVISLVADIAYRMARLNPDLGEEAAIKTPGIVLIDEVDMHLHPSWQQTVINDLTRAFPLVQFIVTTHSPQLLTSVPPESIRILRWKGDAVAIEEPVFALGAESSQLLRDIQRVESRPLSVPIVKDLQRYLQLVCDDQWDSEEALALRKKLDLWSKGREPALIRADMDIRLRRFRRKK